MPTLPTQIIKEGSINKLSIFSWSLNQGNEPEQKLNLELQSLPCSWMMLSLVNTLPQNVFSLTTFSAIQTRKYPQILTQSIKTPSN